MGQINVEGIGIVEIQGDTPTQEESDAIVRAVQEKDMGSFAGQVSEFEQPKQSLSQQFPVLAKLADPFGATALVEKVTGTDLVNPALSLVTGADRRDENLGELPGTLPANLKNLQVGGTNRFPIEQTPMITDAEGKIEFPKNLEFALASARGNPIAEADIFKKAFGDQVQVDFDSFGNPVVTLPNGERKFINAPGLSKADVTNLIPQLGQDILFARLGGRGRGLGRAAGTGLGLGTSSVSSDVIANIMGSKQPIDYKRAALFTAFGFGGEYGADIGGKFIARIIANRRFVKNGKLTEEGVDALKKADIDPERVTPEFLQAFKKLGETDDAIAAARQAEANTLPNPVPMSRANITRTADDTNFEAGAVRGAHGRAAEGVVRDFRNTQNQALAENVPMFQRILDKKSGLGVVREGDGASKFVQGLQKLRTKRKAEVDTAYNNARSQTALLPQESMKSYKQTVDDFLAGEGETLLATPALQPIRKVIDKLAKRETVSMKEIEQVRRLIGNRADGMRVSDPNTSRMLFKMKRQLDDTIEASVDNSLMIGDQAAIQSWKNARQLHRKFAQDFKENKIIGKLLEEDVTPAEATNYLFGVGQFGSANAQNARKALVKMKKIFGKDSQEWSAMRQEAFLRMVRNKITLKEGQAIDAGDLAKGIDTALLRKSDLMKVLFSESERKTMAQLARVARTTRLNTGITNTSGTAAELFRRIPGLSSVVEAASRGENIIASSVGANRALRATKFSLGGKNLTPQGLGGVAFTRQIESQSQ